jgi:hypothetical protein
MSANSEMLERIEDGEMIAARAEAAERLSHRALRDRLQQELIDFALHEMTSEWFYDLELNGAEIEGIGVQGAMELASFRAEQGYAIRFANGVELIEVERHGQLGVQATVVAREAKTQREGLGVAFIPYFEDALGAEDHEKRPVDTRVDRKALSIAKRNAILDLIPDHVVQRIMAARSTAVPRNDERKANQRIAVRNRTAVPVRTVTEQMRKDLEDAGPYDTPSRLQATARVPAPPASTRQIVQLLQLIAHPAVSELTRANIKEKLDTDLSYDLAAKWIPILEAQTREPA